MHLVYAIDRLGAGGAQRQAVELAQRIVREPGVRVSLLSYTGSNFYRDRLQGSAVEVLCLPRRSRYDVAFAWRLKNWLLDQKADLVHSFLVGPIFWNTLAQALMPASKRPVHVAAERDSFDALPAMERRIKAVLYPRASAVTANSQLAAEQIRSRLGIEVRYLPNGIDTADWSRMAQGECALRLDADRFHVAVVGRITAEKNQQAVVQAVRELPAADRRWRFWLIGDDRSEPKLAAELREEIRSAGLDEVQLLPPQPNIAPVIARMDAILMPSLHEGFPNVALEAMALGVPVIASAVGELPRMLENGASGLILDDVRPQTIASALIQLAQEPPERRRVMAERARARVEANYSLDVVAQQHLAFYRELLS